MRLLLDGLTQERISQNSPSWELGTLGEASHAAFKFSSDLFISIAPSIIKLCLGALQRLKPRA